MHILVKAVKTVVKKWPKAPVDFIGHFLGRRCSSCKHFNATDMSCDILTFGVSPDAYFDGWEVDENSKAGFFGTEPSMRIKRIIAGAPHSSKVAVRYYDNIIGVCCSTCVYWRYPKLCAVVDGGIEHWCCCDAWDDKGRMRLKEAKELVRDSNRQFNKIMKKFGKPALYE